MHATLAVRLLPQELSGSSNVHGSNIAGFGCEIAAIRITTYAPYYFSAPCLGAGSAPVSGMRANYPPVRTGYFKSALQIRITALFAKLRDIVFSRTHRIYVGLETHLLEQVEHDPGMFVPRNQQVGQIDVLVII